ncbi:hypothetical protein [Corynebacterium sp. HS2168-gen11]|uniref:hypothetical protein n=1 Tax=Corynebacterium sp. HS2168-gen11 TaxID=2974027 RepID=UPI00216AF4DB|nr:hypothetical protein [Corynebacterium sp. HS2168-gen11]MCS4536266.1 hypothetical protein [Corynebacterium sp. HS2168-gen11]
MSDTVHPIADPTDSLLGWASHYDVELQQKLESLTLVAELGIASDEWEKIEKFYGIFLARQIAAGSTLDALLAISPAMALVTLVRRAHHLVDPECFASDYLSGLGLDTDERLQAALTTYLDEHLSSMCQQLGLAVFDTDAVTALAYHSGIIANEVPLLLESYDQHDGTAEQLPEYLAGLVQQLPEHGAELLAGVAALREFSLAHPQSWVDRSHSHLSPQLPPALAEAIVAELRERPVGTVDRQAAVGVANRELRPRVVFQADRGKVYLRLPEQKVPVTGEITWRVSLEGSTTVYRTARSWGDVTGFAEPLDIALDHPVREVTVEDLANGITWTVPVVHADDPVLLFNKRGGSVTDKRSLHHQRLRVLTPAEHTLYDAVHNRQIHPTNSYEIEGWNGWTLHEVTLEGIDSFDSVPNGQHIDLGRTRSVDPRARVMFRTPDDAVAGVTTMGGLKVHSQSLLAEFPPTPSGASEIWHLAISSYAGAGTAGEEVIQPEPLEVPAEGGIFEVFDPELYDAPWVGEYLVRMRGPRNESFRHEFAIVEGIRTTITYAGLSGSFRIPSGGGLSESTLIVKPSLKPFQVEPKHPLVQPTESGVDFVISTEEGDALPLRFSPPRLTFEMPLLTEPLAWRASRMTVHPRNVDPAGFIRIRGIGVLGNPRISVINHHGQPVATAKLISNDADTTFVAPIAKLISATNMLPRGQVRFEWTDPASDKRISVVLADVATTEPATVELVENELHIHTDSTNVGVWVWPATAPWEPAHNFVVHDNTVVLPETFVNAGNLVVQVYDRDPFTVMRTPAAPGSAALLVEQPGFFGSQDTALGALSAFMSGQTDEVPSDPAVMPVLWDMLAAGGRREESLQAVRTVFTANPNKALLGLSKSLVKSHQQPGRVIETGLVRCVFDAPLNTDESYHRAAWIGALELLGSLSTLYGEDGITAEQRPLAKDIYQQLQDLAGKNVLQVLQTGRDTTLDTACIDRSTVMIAGLDPAQQQAILQQLFASSNIVPGAVLDDGNRLLAVFEAFNTRQALKKLLAEEQLIASAVTLLRTLRSTDKTIYALARIRFDKLDGVDTDNKDNVWALAPVVSLVLALAARMAAHGIISSSKTLDAATQGWAKLADIVPDLVTSDLVAAEAIILALKKPGIA